MAELTCEDIGVTEEGHRLMIDSGEWEVRNVIGSAQDQGNTTKFWERHARRWGGRPIYLTKQRCGIYGCRNPAEEGSHVWLRRVGARNRLSAFCFIMPICRSCNREEENEKNFFKIKHDARFVACAVQNGME